MKISVREGWEERANSVASYAFGEKVLHIADGNLDQSLEDPIGEKEGIIILDAEYVKNAPFEEVVDAIVHESIHDAILKSNRSEGRCDKFNAYWKYDNVQDLVEFWTERSKDEPGKHEFKSGKGRSTEKWRKNLNKLLALIIICLMLIAALIF